MLYCALSDTGRVRKKNEDNYYIPSPGENSAGDIVMVADGLGGHNAGDVASALAVSTIREIILRLCAENPGMKQPQLMRRSIRTANERIYKRANSEDGLRGMATTLTMAALTPAKIYLGHIGDSRAYLISGGGMLQLSEDHTVLQAAIRSGEYTCEQAMEKFGTHMITKALGIFKAMEPDIKAISWFPGDRLLLCSDGLTSEVSDEDIFQLMQGEDIKLCAAALVNKALFTGGRDNITVAVALNTGKEGIDA